MRPGNRSAAQNRAGSGSSGYLLANQIVGASPCVPTTSVPPRAAAAAAWLLGRTVRPGLRAGRVLAPASYPAGMRGRRALVALLAMPALAACEPGGAVTPDGPVAARVTAGAITYTAAPVRPSGLPDERPVSTIRIAADARPGYYNLITRISEDGGGAGGSSVIQIVG